MNFHILHTHKWVSIIGVACVAVACSSPRSAEITRGAEHNYTDHVFEEGHPVVRMTAMGFLDEEGEGIIHVAADIEDESLIFREHEGVNAAEFEITITVVGTAGHTYSDSYSEIKTINNENDSYLTNFDVLRFEKDMEVPPGDYKVFVAVIDKASGNQTVRDVDTFIPDPDEEVVNLTSVQLLGKDLDRPQESYEPVTTYDVSTRKDSLRFVVQVTNNETEDPLVVRSRLVEFEADTKAARPVHHPNYSVSSLPYKGIDFDSAEEMEQTERVLEQPGSVMIEFPFEGRREGTTGLR